MALLCFQPFVDVLRHTGIIASLIPFAHSMFSLFFVWISSQGSKAMFVDFVNAPVIDNEHPPDLKDVADIAQPFDTVAEVAPSASPVQSQKTSRGKKEAKNKSNPGSTCMLCDDPLAMTESLITKASLKDIFNCCRFFVFQCEGWHDPD